MSSDLLPAFCSSLSPLSLVPVADLFLACHSSHPWAEKPTRRHSGAWHVVVISLLFILPKGLSGFVWGPASLIQVLLYSLYLLTLAVKTHGINSPIIVLKLSRKLYYFIFLLFHLSNVSKSE